MAAKKLSGNIFDLVGNLATVVKSLQPTKGVKALRENRRWLRFIKKVYRDVRKEKIDDRVAEILLNPKLRTIGIEEAVEAREFLKHLLETDIRDRVALEYEIFQDMSEELSI